MGKLFVSNGDDAKSMTLQLLEAIRPEKEMDPGMRIGLKPNLIVAKSYLGGATTNPEICETVISYLFDCGIKNVCVIESSWLAVNTRDAFKACGYEALAKKYGIELVDVKKDACVTREFGGMKIDISEQAVELPYLINLPLIKGHCQTGITCALKNLKGLIPDREKRRFHAMGLHKPIAYLNKMISPQLTIADGILTDPGFEEGGNPVRMNTMVAGKDSVLIDAYAAELLGYDPSDIGYIDIASKIGVGSADLAGADIVYLNGKEQLPQHTRLEALRSAKAHIRQGSACSACYGNLVSALLGIEEADLGDIQICVGQDYKGKAGDIGCGSCTSGFQHCIEGCPPAADEIEKEIKKLRGIL